ncbi:MAG: formimidoylglutamate deiminase [Pseudomonadota bacterium]
MAGIFAQTALTADGWRDNVRLTINGARIEAVKADAAPEASDQRVGILLPAPANLHSHAFQRAMAGLAETRTADRDSFWTWRDTMYRFVTALTPDDVEAIAAFVQVEMLEAGFAAVGEFHYLHHAPDGSRYERIAEMSERIVAAAKHTGIGLTLLPVLYMRGGCDGRALSGGQRRFGSTLEGFARLCEGAKAALEELPDDARFGTAPHSLRAVPPEHLRDAAALAEGGPVHIHAAEQLAEVDEVLAATGMRPVEALLDHGIDENWCLIHTTHLEAHEVTGLASSRATAGLCPLTEASLGDGTFRGSEFLAAGGRFGVGSDSHIAIDLAGELRQLEVSQRLRDHARAVLARTDASNGAVLWKGAAAGGATACARDAGSIAVGKLADLVALDAAHIDFIGRRGDQLLDAFIFSGTARPVTDVWSAGRHLVEGGIHQRRHEVEARYRDALKDLMWRL